MKKSIVTIENYIKSSEYTLTKSELLEYCRLLDIAESYKENGDLDMWLIAYANAINFYYKITL